MKIPLVEGFVINAVQAKFCLIVLGKALRQQVVQNAL